jgi:hypothetical protein
LVLAGEILAANSNDGGHAGRTALRLRHGEVLYVADTPSEILAKIKQAS